MSVAKKISFMLWIALLIGFALWAFANPAFAAPSVGEHRGKVRIAAGNAHSLAVTPDGRVVAWGANHFGQTNVPDEALRDVVSVAAGHDHSLALKSDGSVVAWGYNDAGQATVPDEAKHGVVSIAASWHFSVALKADGSVVAWGNGNAVNVPVEAKSDVKAIEAGENHVMALKSDGSVIVWGSNAVGEADVPVAAKSDVVAIAAGFSSSMALKSDGSVVAWGVNNYGQRNVPNEAKSDVVAIAAGNYHMLALKSDGSVVAWGRNIAGETSVPVEAKGGVAAIAGGGVHSLALKSDGSIVGWGLGEGATPPHDISILVKAGAIAAGKDRSLALTTDGGVKAFGSGQSTVPDEAKSGVVAMATGNFHSLALREDGSVIAWGENNYGQSTVPVEAKSGVSAIAAGALHSIALTTGGSVVTWGFNFYGQVPEAARSGVAAIAARNSISLALKTDGSVIAWGDNSFHQMDVPDEAKSGVVAIAAGVTHVLALKTDGSVVAWGGNLSGQSTVPDEAMSGVVAIAAGDYHSLALKTDGSVVAWGNNLAGEATVPDEAKSGVTAVAAGEVHSLALRVDGSVTAWGENSLGQISFPTNANISALTMEADHVLFNFDPSTQDSFVEHVGSSVTEVDITAVLDDSSHSVLRINEEFQMSGSVVNIPLNNYLTEISIRVDPYFAEGKTYTLTVIREDEIPPTLNIRMNTDEDQLYTDGDWTNQSVTVSVSASDGESGLAAIEYSLDDGTTWSVYVDELTYDAEGIHSVQIRATDNADNATTSVVSIQIDRTEPTVAIEMETEDGASYTDGDWTNQSVTVSVSASDGESGLGTVEYSLDGGATWNAYVEALSIHAEGEHSLLVRATDNVGNTTTDFRTIKISRGGLKVFVDLEKADGSTYMSGEWTNQTVTASVYATTNRPGIAVTITEYSLDGGITWKPYSEPISIHSEGTHPLHVRVTDSAGNTTTESRTIKISRSGLEVLVGLEKADGSTYMSGEWTNQTVTASVYATTNQPGITVVATEYSVDNGSTWNEYDDGLTFNSEGVHSFIAKATDSAGNSMTSNVMIRMDQTLPTVSILLQTSNGIPYFNGDWTTETVTASVYATDGASGLSSLLISMDNGVSWQTYQDSITFSYAGTYKLIARARDEAGNETVIDAIIRIVSDSGSSPQSGTMQEAPAPLQELWTVTPASRGATAVLNQGALNQWLRQENVTSVLEIAVPVHYLQVRIPIEAWKEKEQYRAITTLRIESNLASYDLPIHSIASEWVEREFVNPSGEVEIRIHIGIAEEGMTHSAQQTVMAQNGQPLTSLIEFHIEVTDGVKSIPIRNFGSTYVLRKIYLPNLSIDPAQVTVVLWNPESGSMTYVPAVFRQSDSGWEADIFRTGNSGYMVIRSTVTFKDIEGHWAGRNIEWLASKRIVSGVNADEFRPDQNITRAEFSAMLVRSLGLDEGTASGASEKVYKDVQENAWYAKALQTASRNGLINGYGDGTFRPNATINREEIAVLIDRAYAFASSLRELEGHDAVLGKFEDQEHISEWSREGIARLVENGLATGRSADRFAPKETATRAEAAIFIGRLLVHLGFMNEW